MNLSKQLFSNDEKKFVEYLNDLKEYPFKVDSFKFLIVHSNSDKIVLSSLFEGLLKNYLIIQYDNFYLIIFHNKERVKIENYIEMFSEDIGQMISIFEGFNVNLERINLFKEFLNIYEKNFKDVHYTYMNISNIILKLNNNHNEINIIKNLVLDKALQDNEFKRLVQCLFENNLNVSKTAVAMYMHRNTINNKLANLEKDTTMSLQKFKDAIALYELLK